MKIFVTGGAGYIGSVATECLLREGHEVVVFDSLERGHREAIDECATFIQGDLRDRDVIGAAIAKTKPDAVMHFAAYALVGESMDDPMLYFRNNVQGGMHLVEAMLEHGVRKIIFSSTCATYGAPDKVPMTEDLSQRPTNPYGESKLMLERCLSWCQERKGLQPVFLRYFNAAGATEKFGEDHDPETHLIPNVLAVPLGKRAVVEVYGDDYDTPDGSCIRDYIHIEDLAQAHRLAITGDHVGAFNLGNGNGYSVMDVIQAAREVSGHEIPVKMMPRRPGDPPQLIASSEKAFSVLGWKPNYADLHSILESAWKWHQAHPNGYRS